MPKLMFFSAWQESVSKSPGKLFDSSDDEDSDSKEDSTRFSIKPQFEGRAGQKVSQ